MVKFKVVVPIFYRGYWYDFKDSVFEGVLQKDNSIYANIPNCEVNVFYKEEYKLI